MKELNANEKRVLEAVKTQIVSCTGNQFGFTDEITVDGLSKHQVAGYVGDLSSKELIGLYPDEEGGSWVQVLLTKAGASILGATDFETAD